MSSPERHKHTPGQCVLSKTTLPTMQPISPLAGRQPSESQPCDAASGRAAAALEELLSSMLGPKSRTETDNAQTGPIFLTSIKCARGDVVLFPLIHLSAAERSDHVPGCRFIRHNKVDVFGDPSVNFVGASR